ncbi:xanthine dehydrogenase accessory protein XdhC [Parasedimentitalea huanghaiensis]|uniref:Xanthine dehydrogenase accessory protein XdhC n=1 Tax=Parasedimentitalea huanghaiensis TaxID=2682100 RepID=A0A6L6WLZ8_9RHOB|nr:xanthine dehydrogenase accessory protein XdhC [Zongyanglinia huanghaiensis]MVO18350.1 xanthine dehydrogenase accessory protein XdhC [Zongyanglinia huanghaiensis]
MGFDLQGLKSAVTAHGRVTRVVIADIRGSSPREVGAAMLVWSSGQSGTIGGGTLEYEAAETARSQSKDRVLSKHALGPDLGQCCGGVVFLLSEVYDAAKVAALDEELIARPADPAPVPMSVTRVLTKLRNQGQRPVPQLIDGWMIEPVHKPDTPLWIWGAGHVGRALVDVLSPLPDLDITWVDTAPERFPENIAEGVTAVPASDPTLLVPHAPENAQHLVLTYSHTLDLALCHALLKHEFSFAGLIGSATKWARFRSRLGGLGHSAGHIARITCPIGDPSLGKHPQMIAVGVAGEILRAGAKEELKKDRRA